MQGIKLSFWPDIIIKIGVYFSTFFSVSVFVLIYFILLEIGRVYLDHSGFDLTGQVGGMLLVSQPK